ncbi:MAG: hypothetical protein SVX43_12655 [Cyanobacteriota bacterium]|nr:hypothetical protein [Cyanobacteriota bacterium]
METKGRAQRFSQSARDRGCKSVRRMIENRLLFLLSADSLVVLSKF